MQRMELVKKLYEGLNEDGIFIFSEKVVFKDKKLDKDLIDIYYDYKKEQGYSEYEIAQKREALGKCTHSFYDRRKYTNV